MLHWTPEHAARQGHMVSQVVLGYLESGSPTLRARCNQLSKTAGFPLCFHGNLGSGWLIPWLRPTCRCPLSAADELSWLVINAPAGRHCANQYGRELICCGELNTSDWFNVLGWALRGAEWHKRIQISLQNWFLELEIYKAAVAHGPLRM